MSTSPEPSSNTPPISPAASGAPGHSGFSEQTGKSAAAAGGRGGAHVLQAPTGTRDMYPADLNRLRYVQQAWRRTSINHGFEEIDGPTFEHLELYTIKSGEGIVSELFSFERFGGEKTFALRPEFTPTLARMYAAKAASLPKPTKWFWQQNCYRAERPQRGRLREFCQWNCDIIGDDSPQADAEAIACCVGMLESLGLTPKDVRIKVNLRHIASQLLDLCGVAVDKKEAAFALIDRRGKIEDIRWLEEAQRLSPALMGFDSLAKVISNHFASDDASLSIELTPGLIPQQTSTRIEASAINSLRTVLGAAGLSEWCDFDPSIVRGLAYYTGMVFEVHEASGAERAIAGGGRYDKLIEMFGGPPTPAVGFGMGDVVLSLVLKDKGLMPTDEKIAVELGLNPDALVVSNGTPEADAALPGIVAELRKARLHARRSSKKIGKAIQEAAKLGARYCVILEGEGKATIKNLATQGQESCGVGEVVAKVGAGASRATGS